MVRHLEGDVKKQFAVAEKTIEACAEFLSDPRIHQATRGLSERALFLLTQLYVPNNVDGVYDLSDKKATEGGIPYIIAKPNEKIRARRKADHIIHPLQRDGLRESMCDIEQQELTDAQFEKRLRLIRKSYKEEHGDAFKLKKLARLNADAYVHAPAGAIGLSPRKVKPKTYLLRTSPVVVADGNALMDDIGTSLLFHEIVHVNQDLSGRLFREKNKVLEDEKYACELEAYWAQATALEIHMGTPLDGASDYNCFGVEAARREVNDESDPFRVSKALLNAVKKNGSRLR